MDGICYIFGALDPGKIHIEKTSADLLIAADGGLDRARALGLEPDLILGDFDSLGRVPQEENVTVFPPEKDYTDLDLALRIGLERNCKSFCIFGAMGGRPDHSFANYQLLASLAEKGMRGLLCGEGWCASAVHDGFLELPPREKGYVSVFSVSEKAEGVCLEGLKYSLENASLSSLFPLGVSNEFTGSAVKISVREGTLLVLWQESGEMPDVSVLRKHG